ncbi:transmembrane emp24 domain-containing protein bai-like [Tachypleus tridentatus]|uniref:transmembrane emp24 domain-containing protein bai-like n=1 Tax=Tachypleus tridentatus TaxID=6853 RepID=UPI003FD0CCF7
MWFRNMYKCYIYFFVIYLVVTVESLMLHLTPNSKRCLKEEIEKKVLVTGEYELGDAPGQKTDIAVTDSKGQVLVSRENIDRGKFAFNTDEFDVFEICFLTKLPVGQGGMMREATLTLKHGVEAKSYDGLEEVGKLKPLEIELQKLEDMSEAIVKDFAYMRQREEEMRDTNESTNTRVLYFSIFSMCCLLALTTWQVLYLRRFFKAKKLIE